MIKRIMVMVLFASLAFGQTIGRDHVVRYSGDKTLWEDLQINISSVRLPASNAPTWTAYKGSQVLAFDGSSTDIIYFTAQMPHARLVNSDVEFHIHYVPEDNAAGNVAWEFTYSWASINGTFSAETVDTVYLSTPEVADKHILGEIAEDISGTGKGISSFLLCSLKRLGGLAADTYDGKSIYLIGADFHVEIDQPGGSNDEASKQ